jgi:hypothetical protein
LNKKGPSFEDDRTSTITRPRDERLGGAFPASKAPGYPYPEDFPERNKERSALGLLNDAALFTPQDFTDQKREIA